MSARSSLAAQLDALEGLAAATVPDLPAGVHVGATYVATDERRYRTDDGYAYHRTTARWSIVAVDARSLEAVRVEVLAEEGRPTWAPVTTDHRSTTMTAAFVHYLDAGEVVLDGPADVDADEVIALLAADGITATWEHTGGGCAALVVGAFDPDAETWEITVGPGVYADRVLEGAEPLAVSGPGSIAHDVPAGATAADVARLVATVARG